MRVAFVNKHGLHDGVASFCREQKIVCKETIYGSLYIGYLEDARAIRNLMAYFRNKFAVRAEYVNLKGE